MSGSATTVRRTPVLRIEPTTTGLGPPVWVKLESQQVTGTFKARNAFALLSTVEVPHAGVVAASGGNFGLAMAHAARRLGHRMTVVVPESTPREKLEAIRREDAEVEAVADPAARAFAVAERLAAARGALLAHPYDLPAVAAGAGTCALELEEQCPGPGHGPGRRGGWRADRRHRHLARDRARVVAVETEGTPTLHAALGAGGPVEVTATGVGMSALGAPVIGEIAWCARHLFDRSLLVTDESRHELRRVRRYPSTVDAPPTTVDR
jgi:threonine dehydratase